MGLKKHPVEPELSNELGSALSELQAKVHGCPSPDLLQAAQAGVLPADQARETQQHLEGCSICRSLLADLEALDAVELDKAGRQRIWAQIREQMPAEPADRRARAWWFRPFPLAAATAAMVVVVVTTVVVRGRRSPGPVIAENRPPISVPGATSVFRLEKAPIVLPPSATIVWRGGGGSASKPAEDLKQALIPYQQNDYAEAARRLTAVRRKYPRMGEAAYYLGISQMFLNDNQQAAATLQDAVDLADPVLKNKATWYLALADYRTGKIDAASSLLAKVCQTGGDDSARACSGVTELQNRH